MATSHAFRFARIALVFGLGALLASSCVVDTSGLIFDDEAYENALDGEGGEGGQVPGSGGEVSLGGGGGLGGETSSGGTLNLGGSGNVCEANEMRCDGKQVQLCSANDWIDIGGPCPNACVDGICTGMCSPGADECLSSIQTQHCNDIGEWEADFCEFACVGGTCGGVCRPGERSCMGDTRRLCLDTGEWQDQELCPGDCEDGVCVGACILGNTQCKGDSENPVQITCDNTSWETSTETPCDYVCQEETGQCGGECVPFSSACASPTSVEVCGATGFYAEPTPCPYICDDDTGACGGSCVPNTKRCSGGDIETCNGDGEWVQTTDCTGSTPVCLEATAGAPACVACTPGTKKCAASANSVLTCSASGSWPVSGTACKASLKGGVTVCWAGACEDTDEVCPSTCTKACPRGCADGDTRWYCTNPIIGTPTFTTANCASGDACVSGVCE